MNIQEFTVVLNNQEVTVRLGDVAVPKVQVTQTTFGKLQILGGIPGPPGQDGADGGVALSEHIVAVEPHPAYDDLPSMTLLFENGLV